MPPGYQRAVATDHHAVISSCRQPSYCLAKQSTGAAGCVHRHGRITLRRAVVSKLSIAVVSPRNQGAIAAQGQTVAAAGCNGDDRFAKQRTDPTRRIDGHRDRTIRGGVVPKLAARIIPPGHYRTIAAQRQKVAAAARYLNDGFSCQHTTAVHVPRYRSRGRRRRVVTKLPLVICAPGRQASVGPQQHQVIAISAIVPRDEGIGDAAVGEIYCSPVGDIAELPTDKAQAGIVDHCQVGPRHRRVAEGQRRRAVGSVAGGCLRHARSGVEGVSDSGVGVECVGRICTTRGGDQHAGGATRARRRSAGDGGIADYGHLGGCRTADGNTGGSSETGAGDRHAGAARRAATGGGDGGDGGRTDRQRNGVKMERVRRLWRDRDGLSGRAGSESVINADAIM